ncbi:RnfABCDGE type electron transport complex subunit G [Lacrimispora sp. JR3]|uniref:RnfABCDGE type electron transport complex subunit G n=1 Tax=Lacrimispora sinapis TaxID=3111456 RepID=UPI003747874F
MKNSRIIKDALILFVITVISGLLLGGVHELTKETIEKSGMSAKNEANRAVFPEASEFKTDDKLTEAVESSNAELPSKDYGNVGIDQALAAIDESGTVLGYAVTCYSNDSYNGPVKILVGINADKSLKGIEVLEINDTPGLGQLAKEPAFKGQFTGKSAETLTVAQSGSGGESEINAISGATITSRAVTNAVNAALYLAYHHIEQ